MKKHKGNKDAQVLLDQVLASAAKQVKERGQQKGEDGGFGFLISFNPSEVKKRGSGKSTVKVRRLIPPQ